MPIYICTGTCGLEFTAVVAFQQADAKMQGPYAQLLRSAEGARPIPRVRESYERCHVLRGPLQTGKHLSAQRNTLVSSLSSFVVVRARLWSR